MQSSSVSYAAPVQWNGGPPQAMPGTTLRDMFLWPMYRVSSVSRTRGLLYWVLALWQRRHWSPGLLPVRSGGVYAVRAGMTQRPVHVPVVTQVPPSFAQVTLLRSSSIITMEQRLVLLFQS